MENQNQNTNQNINFKIYKTSSKDITEEGLLNYIDIMIDDHMDGGSTLNELNNLITINNQFKSYYLINITVLNNTLIKNNIRLSDREKIDLLRLYLQDIKEINFYLKNLFELQYKLLEVKNNLKEQKKNILKLI